MMAATNGRIPRRNGEYRFTNDDKHCQYCRPCGTSISTLNKTKKSLSRALSFGLTVSATQLTSIPKISAVCEKTFFFTDRPSKPTTPLIVVWVIS